MMVTDGVKHLVPLDQIRGGGPPKDGIPSIDDPKFAITAESQFMSDDDVIVGLNLNGESRAYPLSILVWHEIVNDKLGKTPVAITYCPLCYTTQVFDRTIIGQEVEFGTSGKLYNSNLVMYDRLTDSYWSQSLGIAIKGELAGTKLERIPFDVMQWKDWKQLYPDTVVLTTETGHVRSYETDPYGDYYTDSRIIFPVSNKDPRMHVKEIIIGVEQDGLFKAYKQRDIESAKIINDVIGEKELVLMSLFKDNSRAFYRQIDGNLLEFSYTEDKIIDEMTGSEWNYEGVATSGQLKGAQLVRVPFDPSFWFEWVAIHPQTEVYQN